MLTNLQIKSAQPKSKTYKQTDGRGLYLQVNPNGSKWWRFRYKFGGREKLLSLGTYPDTSLKSAREKREAARQLLADDIDPSAERQAAREAQASTFKAVALEWLEVAGNPSSGALKQVTIKQLTRRLEKYAFPKLGNSPISSIEPRDLLRVLRRLEANGTHETAHRVRALCSRVFRYAIATGRAERDIAADLKGALAAVKTQHFAAIVEPRRIGELLRSIDGYEGHETVAAALRLAPLVFVRPGELRAALWDEFDLEAGEWRIGAERMKMGRPHLVPLASQAVEILEDLHAHTGDSDYVFPSIRSKERPMSDNTLNAALRRLGFAKHEMTAHGFRSMASTRLNEMGYPPDIIELQLAHQETNKVRAAYNRAERLAERRDMMQAWADYLDGLRSDKRATVTALYA